MATINVGGRTVEVPDDLDPTKGPAQSLRNNAFGDAAAQTTNPRTVAPQPPMARAPLTGMSMSERPMSLADTKLFPNSPVAADMAAHGDRVNPVSAPARSNFVSPGVGSHFGPEPVVPGSQGSVADRLRTGAQNAWDDVRGRPNVGPQKPLAGFARAKDLAGQGANVLGRVGGAFTVGDSAVENAGSMGRLWANDNAGTIDKIAGTAEGLGNVAAETALSFTKKFPVIGPMIAGAVGPSPVSRIASMFPAGSTLQKYAGADPTTNAEQMLRSPATSKVPPITTSTPQTVTDVQRGGGNAAPVVPNGVLRQGNSYSGPAGIGGDITVNGSGGRGTVSMMGGQPGDATPAQRLAQIERDTAHAREMNGLRQQVADSQNPMAGVTGLIGSGGYGGARTPEQLARDAAVSASSITNTQGLSARQRRSFAQQDAQLALEARRNDQNNETVRRGQDLTHGSTLRGQDLNFGSTTRGQDLDYQGKVMQNQTAAQRLRYDMGKDMRDFAETKRMNDNTLETAEQTRGKYATDNARNEFTVYAPGKDGGPSVKDEGLSSKSFQAVRKILPGIDSMHEDTRNKALPEAHALQSIFSRVWDQKQMGFDKINPLERRGPARDSLPDFRGGKLKQQGLAGAITPGGSVGNYYVEHNGRDIPLGNDLSERELEILNHHLQTGSWLGAPKKTQKGN